MDLLLSLAHLSLALPCQGGARGRWVDFCFLSPGRPERGVECGMSGIRESGQIYFVDKVPIY